jgi:hypothetical protein
MYELTELRVSQDIICSSFLICEAGKLRIPPWRDFGRRD